ncbi:MAG: hypothetical protein AB7V56_15280 [Candidatus Nitrosocosmicus sp.]|nr:hypothetical protein [Candidatus Nitrosocosmicus sp.]
MNKINLKFYVVAIVIAATTGLAYMSISSTFVAAQTDPQINIGNNSGMASDEFFQLDDSILKMKSLVNETQTSLENNNTAEAENNLNQIYNELVQISNNSNSLIWDESNEGN